MDRGGGIAESCGDFRNGDGQRLREFHDFSFFMTM
jgi:hypothetical protein